MPTTENKKSIVNDEPVIEVLVNNKTEEGKRYNNDKTHTFLNVLIDRKIINEIITAIIN